MTKYETAIIDNIDKFEKIWSDVSFRKHSCAILRMREREREKSYAKSRWFSSAAHAVGKWFPEIMLEQKKSFNS